MHTQYMMHSPRLVLEYSVNIKHVLPILICPDKWGPHCRILLKICPFLPCFWLEMLLLATKLTSHIWGFSIKLWFCLT